jgi:hypothetical protein
VALGSCSRGILLAVLFIGADYLPAGAQFRTTAEGVEVPVMVVHKRKPVTGLTAADFVVLEDGQPVNITDAAIDSRPLDVTLLLDVSESTALPWIRAHTGLLAAADGVGRLLRADDAFAVYRFSERLERIDLETPSALAPRGQTAIFDAILEVLLQRPQSSRRLVIVLTDGLDTASSVPLEITRTVVERSDAIIHIVALSGQAGHWYFGEIWSGRGVIREFFAELEALATGSGGRFFSVETPNEFLPALGELLEQERTRYYLRYAPATLSPGWHEISVSTTSREHQVSHRRGYWRPR